MCHLCLKQKKITQTHRKDYSRRPASLYVLHLRERERPLHTTRWRYSVFIIQRKGNRNCRSTNHRYVNAEFSYNFHTTRVNVAKQLGKTELKLQWHAHKASPFFSTFLFTITDSLSVGVISLARFHHRFHMLSRPKCSRQGLPTANSARHTALTRATDRQQWPVVCRGPIKTLSSTWSTFVKSM